MSRDDGEKGGWDRSRSIKKVAFYSFLINCALFATKLFLSAVSGSLALRADAVHSLVDVFDSAALILGLYISERKSKSFPYGLYKVENIFSVFIALMIFFTAFEIGRHAVAAQASPIYGDWVIFVVAAMIPVPFLFGLYEVRAGKAANSPSLMADGTQFKADALTESIVLFALIGQRFGLPLDRVAALLIAFFVVRGGWDILKSGMRVLLDASVDAPTLETIRETIEAEPTVSAVKAVTARNSGRYLFVEAEVAFRIGDLKRAHQTSERIEREIREKVPHVVRVLIHYEPQKRTHLRYAIPLADAAGMVSDHFGEAPYFALVDIDLSKRAMVRQEFLANPHLDLTKGRGLKVAGFLLGRKPDAVVTRENLAGKGPGYVFAEAGVETIQMDGDRLEALIDEILKRID
ncbi:MAG: cation diffusion facilitator family transporter [Methanothrix sp.]|nr:cation diffusion facilitator family transporter [Methanothrix sp.]